ncbi:hypothetical protein [Dethiosulfatarculus sandiegensis]|uniref:Uncharacterized protein n=1 Tax=Dethiosulfatarculus sandiegensis TaxID=1429043 RepID=A0A0D2K1M8_9BACT|nr:hypothetical protein [Dethiosulfatarculus sandiegensis]KIX15575.1 hypothetical protein X474_02420 [Dethiosulfatarculus sandiegensis]
MHCTLAKIDESSLEQIKNLEKKTGKVVLAYACQQANAANLSADQVSELQGLEKKLGMTLVALDA